MFKHFYKYQSLGNDFVLFDCYKKPELHLKRALDNVTFSTTVRSLCDRHFGVGADGVLVLKESAGLGLPEMLIFNSDGTRAQMCLNGLRCVATHLYLNHNFPLEFKIKIGDKIVDCSALVSQNSDDSVQILTKIGSINYINQSCIFVDNAKFCGHVVDVGNPHFIMFEQVSLDWLKEQGAKFESHEAFPQKTNVEFVWMEDPLNYRAVVYERGCGVTLACSSGAAAIVGVISKLGYVAHNQEFNIHMPGGKIVCYVNDVQEVFLRAEALFVFRGVFAK